MIVCVEGVNGAGKTTLATALLNGWQGGHARAIDPVRHTGFGETVRTAIMAESALCVDAETLAFAAARLHTAEALTAATADLVVLERWAGAVVAYGTVAYASPFLLRALEAALAGALPVDVTVLVDVPGEVAVGRLGQLDEDPNRFESQGPAYLEKVRRQYLAWAAMRQVPVLNGQQEEAAIVEQTTRLIKSRAVAIGGHITKESA